MERLSISESQLLNRSEIVYRVDRPRRRASLMRRLRRVWHHEAWLLRSSVAALADVAGRLH